MKPIKQDLDRKINTQGLAARLQNLTEEVQKNQEVQDFINEHRDQLTDDEILRSLSKLYEFVKEKEKFNLNDPSMLAPGYEPKLFMNHHYIDVTYVPTESFLKQKEQLKIKNRVHAIDMPKDIKEASLANFTQTNERRQALIKAFDFVQQYSQNPNLFHRALYLQGTFGVGKTYLLGAIANQLAALGFQSTIIHFPTFCVEMKQAIKDQSVSLKLDQIKKAPILMIDDIGADNLSSWTRDDILGVILQYRMQEELPTFFSSNFDMKQLEEEHLRVAQNGGDEPMKAKRIMERIKFLSEEILMMGENRRLN